SKNNQLKNFFLENKNILYINQEIVSKLNTLSNMKNNEDTYKKTDEIIDEIIETFNKTLEIEYRNLNGSVDNLYYQMLSLYRTRISLIDYQKDLSLNLETEKAEIHNLIDNYKNQIKDTKESLINTIEINKDNLTTYNKNLNNLINEQERKTADQSTKIQSNKIAIDTLTQTLENEITRQKSNIRTSLEDTATDLKNDIKNTKQSLDKDATELNLTMKRYRKIISLSTSEIMLQKFKTNSRIEMWTYYILNLVSLGIVFFLVLESYQSIEAYISKDIKELVERDFHYIILKISLTVISFFILIFISRISNKAHYHWKHNENIYLKLYALKPYISEMSPEKQLEIQEKLIDVYFGKENSSEKKDTDLPENISQIVKTLIEKLPLEISKKDDEK
ncbi:hypothetical protein, partial [Acinetobacter sp. YH12057]